MSFELVGAPGEASSEGNATDDQIDSVLRLLDYRANLKKFTFEFDVLIVFTGDGEKKNIAGVEFKCKTPIDEFNEQCKPAKNGFFQLHERIVGLFRNLGIKHRLHSDKKEANFRWEDEFWNGNVDVYLEPSAFEDPPYFEEEVLMKRIRSDGTFIPTENEDAMDVTQKKSWYPVGGARVKSIGKLVFVIPCPYATLMHMSAARGREAYPPRGFSLQKKSHGLNFPGFVKKTKLVNEGYYTPEDEMEIGAVYGEYKIGKNGDVVAEKHKNQPQVYRYTDDELPFTELLPDSDEEGAKSSFDTDELLENGRKFDAYVGLKKLNK